MRYKQKVYDLKLLFCQFIKSFRDFLLYCKSHAKVFLFFSNQSQIFHVFAYYQTKNKKLEKQTLHSQVD